jgi:hypothetical protein
MTPARPRVRVLPLLVAVLTGLAVLAGCTGTPSPPEPHRLSLDEATTLAGIRARNFDTGVRGIELTVPAIGDEVPLSVVGWYDYVSHLGYAKVTQTGPSPADTAADGTGGSAGESTAESTGDRTAATAQPTAPAVLTVLGLVCWTPVTIGILETTRDELPLPIPASASPLTPLDPTTSTMNGLLALVANLGADRPEDARLLAQSDAQWLRSDFIGGVPVDVYAGPSADAATAEQRLGTAAPTPSGTAPASGGSAAPLLYWVDSSGVLLRVQQSVDRPGESPAVAQVDFTGAGGVRLTEPDPAGETTGGLLPADPTALPSGTPSAESTGLPTEEPTEEPTSGPAFPGLPGDPTGPTDPTDPTALEPPVTSAPAPGEGELPGDELPGDELPPDASFPTELFQTGDLAQTTPLAPPG